MDKNYQKTPLMPTGSRSAGSGWKLLYSTLRVLSGPDAGKSVTVAGRPVSIGKADTCDLRLTDPNVSRAHAVISLEPEGFVIQDLGSTNGTSIEGVPIMQAPLTPGCRIKVGETVVEFAPRTRNLTVVPTGENRLGGLVGGSLVMRELYGLIHLVAPTEATAVIQGETGTGKELAARAIHELSPKANQPFVIFDCANVDRDLLGSGLFGHVRGAYTGAVSDHRGVFETAGGGTLFLDEIGELPLDVQARLLGVLQRREVVPLGGNTPRPIGARVLAATHRNLEKMVQEGAFREDLYFRLVVMTIRMPPLRARREDIPLLVEAFLEEFAAGGPRARPSEDAVAWLLRLPWRGNVRELRNRVERATVLARGGDILPEHLMSGDGSQEGQDRSEPARPAHTAAVPEPDQGLTIREMEHRALFAALQRSGWNKAQAARELGLNVSTVKRKIKELNLKQEDEIPPPITNRDPG